MASEACAFWLLAGSLVCLFFLFCPSFSELQLQGLSAPFHPRAFALAGPLPWLVLCLEACFPAVSMANCLASQRPLSRCHPLEETALSPSQKLRRHCSPPRLLLLTCWLFFLSCLPPWEVLQVLMGISH